LTLYAPSLSCSRQPDLLINGTPAAVLYAGTGQINFVVPATVSGTAAVIAASCAGAPLATITTGLSAAVPALFTQTQTGSGQASIVNSDGTINSAGNPAARGSYVSMYGTGFGALNAPDPDGLRRIAATVAATIGGTSANLIYAGEAPEETTGLQQIIITVPSGVTAGTSVPVTLTANGVATQGGTTISVK
jgi:uncharacterized protein (TIGR03437 family)